MLIGLILAGGVRWLLIGAVLLVAWYILAPLFTPAPVAQSDRRRRGGGYRTRRKGRKGPELEVIDSNGRIVE